MLGKQKRGLRQIIRSWLNITEAEGLRIQIDELLDFDSNVFVNELWYRGDGYELEQLYKSIPDYKFTFWGSVPTAGLEMRKIHTGLPRIIINTLTNVIVDDMENVNFPDLAKEQVWEKIEDANNFKKLVKKAVKEVLVTGDGAFKISIDTDISPLPILEFYSADKIDVIYEHGHVREIVFKKLYKKEGEQYILKEHYGYGYITYQLFTKYDKEVDLSTLDQTKDLANVVFDKSFMLAEYISFYESDKWEGRGQSVLDAKTDNFDALDEAWSQWVDALRANRTKTYIPEDLLPRDANTGAILRGNSFDNRFIRTNTPAQENATVKIETVNGTIAHDSYLSTYVTALDLCLQGLISPSTLGIDTKKLDNAEAQREKEKTTLYTRQTIVVALQDALPKLIDNVFKAISTMQGVAISETECDVPFGEYANPSFESQIETVAKAKTGGVMSIESVIDELYGDSKTEQWKAEEVARIKQEQGIAELEEPSIVDDLGE